MRQRGTRWHVGQNAGIGRDHTIYSKVNGIVKFIKGRKKETPHQSEKDKIHVVPDKIKLVPVPAEWGIDNSLILKFEVLK